MLCFSMYSIEAGKQEVPPVENLFLGLALIFVIIVTGTLSFIQQSRRASINKMYENTFPQVARVIREGEEQEVPVEELVSINTRMINTYH